MLAWCLHACNTTANTCYRPFLQFFITYLPLVSTDNVPTVTGCAASPVYCHLNHTHILSGAAQGHWHLLNSSELCDQVYCVILLNVCVLCVSHPPACACGLTGIAVSTSVSGMRPCGWQTMKIFCLIYSSLSRRIRGRDRSCLYTAFGEACGSISHCSA